MQLNMPAITTHRSGLTMDYALDVLGLLIQGKVSWSTLLGGISLTRVMKLNATHSRYAVKHIQRDSKQSSITGWMKKEENANGVLQPQAPSMSISDSIVDGHTDA